ncbi:hypothetical protein JW887_03280 [Candidatus Dojkabacteria bacterium]|nr:hypothetical protein [Candidatus Dojkabacteria bacterium]
MPTNPDLLSEQVVEFIQKYSSDRIFEPTYSLKKNAKHDEWRQSWLNELGIVSDESRSLYTMRKLQEEVQKQFGERNVIKEKPISNVMHPNSTSHAFDLFIPSERTAIEICLSAIKNEFEKDILKAMLDADTATLYIITRDYVTGKNETVYGVSYLNMPGPQNFINLAKIYKLHIIPVALCPI